MRRLLPLLLLVVVAGLVLLALLWKSGREDAGSVTRSSPVVQAQSAVLPAEPLQSEIVTQPDAHEEREVAEAAPAPASTAPAAESKPSETGLIVHAIGKDDRAPLTRVRVILFPTDPAPGQHGVSHVERSKGDLTSGPISGSDGKVEFELPPGVELELHAHAEDGKCGDVQVRVPALRAGEHRELTVELPQGNDGHVVGKVVTGESNLPVAGARVRLVDAQESWTSGSPKQWNRMDMSSTTTSDDGVFDFRFPSWKHPHLRVEAEGFGLRLASPGKEHDDLQHALLVKLAPDGTLDAHVLDAAGHGIAGAWVHVDAHGYALNRDEESDRGFFTNEYVSLPDEQWKCDTAVDGRATIRGLPAGVGLTVEVRQGGKVLHHEPGELKLEPGQTREIEWRIGSGTQLTGLVLDQNEKPVPRQEIWLQQRVYDMGFYFQSYDSARVVAKKTTSDKEGRFVLADVPAGKWWIGAAANADDEDHARPNAIAAFGESLDTAGEASRDFTLHVYRGLYIRGKVVGPRGDPVQDAFVQGEAEGVMVWKSARSGQDGAFAFGPLKPGTFTLNASGGEKYAASDSVRAQVGDSGVELRLQLGSSLKGRVIDAATGQGCSAQLMFSPETPSTRPWGNGMLTATEGDGTFKQDGFESGRYGITAMTADGRFAQQVGIEVAAGSEVGDIVLALMPGGKLHVDYQGSKKQAHVVIKMAGAMVNFGDSVEAGKPKVLLAPAGSLLLEIRPEYAGPPRTRKVELVAGETMDVVIQDED